MFCARALNAFMAALVIHDQAVFDTFLGRTDRCKMASHLTRNLGGHGEIIVQVSLKIHLLALVQIHVSTCILDA